MIELIYGAKGSGKTQRIIDHANEKAASAKGNVVFVSDKDKYSLSIGSDVRFIVTADYKICCRECLFGFLSGIVAGNADTCHILIDGIARITGEQPEQMEAFLKALEDLSAAHKVDFTLTVSTDVLPKFMMRYL